MWSLSSLAVLSELGFILTIWAPMTENLRTLNCVCVCVSVQWVRPLRTFAFCVPWHEIPRWFGVYFQVWSLCSFWGYLTYEASVPSGGFWLMKVLFLVTTVSEPFMSQHPKKWDLCGFCSLHTCVWSLWAVLMFVVGCKFSELFWHLSCVVWGSYWNSFGVRF